jgi:FAD/FMN-containing dehydrogenase
MGNSPSTALSRCLAGAVDANLDLLAFPGKPFYQFTDVKAYNLDIPVTPAAVTYPQTSDHVAAIVKCAASAQVKVQARCGGHSYGNYGIAHPRLVPIAPDKSC